MMAALMASEIVLVSWYVGVSLPVSLRRMVSIRLTISAFVRVQSAMSFSF